MVKWIISTMEGTKKFWIHEESKKSNELRRIYRFAKVGMYIMHFFG